MKITIIFAIKVSYLPPNGGVINHKKWSSFGDGDRDRETGNVSLWQWESDRRQHEAKGKLGVGYLFQEK